MTHDPDADDASLRSILIPVINGLGVVGVGKGINPTEKCVA